MEFGFEPADQALERRLDEHRPVPAPGFRGALARRLSRRDPGYGPRPERLEAMVAGYTIAGAAFIGLGALVATGAI
jgi:hypothetical protein